MLGLRFPVEVFEELGIEVRCVAAMRHAGRDGSKNPGPRRRYGRGPRRRTWLRFLPEAAMLKNLADHCVPMAFEEGDDFHGAAALRAAQGVGLVDALDEDGPALAEV